jgi:enamine deaminase RidA (YjgF/YER057c/UK114 family)
MTTRRFVAGSAVLTVLVTAVVASGWLAQRTSAQTGSDSFRLEFVGPVGPNVFSRVVIVHTGRVKTIYLSGIATGGPDLTSAATTAFENIVKRLEENGAKKEDLVKVVGYIVNMKPGPATDPSTGYGAYAAAIRKVLTHKDLPANTLVGVTALASATAMIEVEAVAVVRP